MSLLNDNMPGHRWGLSRPLDWKFNSTPSLYLKLSCSLKIMDFRPVLVKKSAAHANYLSICIRETQKSNKVQPLYNSSMM